MLELPSAMTTMNSAISDTAPIIENYETGRQFGFARRSPRPPGEGLGVRDRAMLHSHVKLDSAKISSLQPRLHGIVFRHQIDEAAVVDQLDAVDHGIVHASRFEVGPQRIYLHLAHRLPHLRFR